MKIRSEDAANSLRQMELVVDARLRGYIADEYVVETDSTAFKFLGEAWERMEEARRELWDMQFGRLLR